MFDYNFMFKNVLEYAKRFYNSMKRWRRSIGMSDIYSGILRTRPDFGIVPIMY